jgi:hypothetical protein
LPVILLALIVIAAPLGFGAWRHVALQQQVQETAEQQRDFVPSIRVATVKASDSSVLVSLPATTAAFSRADIFARASG